jgi:hypothetical protein
MKTKRGAFRPARRSKDVNEGRSQEGVRCDVSKAYRAAFRIAHRAALAAACSEDPTGVPYEGLSRADAAFLAVRLSGLGSGTVDEGTAGFEAAPSSNGGFLADVERGPGLLRARACPAGGQLEIDGEMSFSFDDGVLELSFSAEKSMTDCAFERGDDLLTVDGDVAIWGTRRRVDREPSGLQETDIEGSISVTRASTDETRSCDIDISSVFDPETGTREVTGTMCGHDVSERATGDG